MALIGAGRVGTSVAVLLKRAGYRIVAASGGAGSRERVGRYLPGTSFYPAADAANAALGAALILLTVPDDVVGEVCASLAAKDAFRPGQALVHFSGSLALDVLRPAEERGAEILSLHPLQAFPSVDDGVARLPGSAIGVSGLTDEARALGESLARALGGGPFDLPDAVKPLYHAAAVFCSNYLVAVLGVAERLFHLAGVKDPVPRFAPLARSALEATLDRGPLEALTGPAARGDAGTVTRDLSALATSAPGLVEPYEALARVAAGLASEAGRLSEEGRLRLEEVLARWR